MPATAVLVKDGLRLVWAQVGLAVAVYLPAAVFCCGRSKWPLSAEPGRSFLSPFPPPRAVSSRSRLCTSGAILPQEGRPAGRDCFCFYGATGWGRQVLGWKATPSKGGGPALKPWFPLIKHCFKGDTLQILPSPGPSRGGALLPACFPGPLPPRAHSRPKDRGQRLTSRKRVLSTQDPNYCTAFQHKC